MRCVSTRVLPDPAPASTSSGPVPCVTASRWGGFSPSSSCSARAALRSAPPLRARALGSSAVRPRRSAASPPAGFWPCPRRSGRTSPACLRSLPVRSATSRSSSPMRSASPLQRVGDRVRQVQPVGVRALRPASLDPHRVARVADHGRVRRARRGSTTEFAPTLAPWPTVIGPSSFAPEPIVTLSSTVGCRLPRGEAGAAERDALVERHAVADLRRLADHDARAVVDEEVAARSWPPGGSRFRSRSGSRSTAARGTSGTSGLVQRVRDRGARGSRARRGRSSRISTVPTPRARPGRGRARRRRPRAARAPRVRVADSPSCRGSLAHLAARGRERLRAPAPPPVRPSSACSRPRSRAPRRRSSMPPRASAPPRAVAAATSWPSRIASASAASRSTG